MSSPNSSKRICIVGLDGVGPYNLMRLKNMYMASNITGIADRGVTGSFLSIPPYTPSAWTSIFSGVNPGKHGVYGFFKVLRSGTGDEFRPSYTLTTSFDIGYPRIFEMASMHGLKSVVVNVPITYPVSGIVGLRNMIIVSDWASPKQFIYPRKLEYKYGEYLDEPPHSWSKYSDTKLYISLVEEYLKKRLNMYYELLYNNNFNIFIIIFSELDWLMHHIPELVEGRNLEYVSKIVHYIDKFVKDVKELCDLTVLVSDHGFQVVKFMLGVNNILANFGLLPYKYVFDKQKLFKFLGISYRGDVRQGRSRRSRKGRKIFSSIVGEFSQPITRMLGKINKIIPSHIIKRVEDIVPLRVVPVYASSRAYMHEAGNWGVYVRKEYESIIKRIFDNNPLIDRVVSKYDVFWGPYVGSAPDLLLIPKPHVAYDPRVYADPIYRVNIGNHEPHALVAFYGDDVVSGGDEIDVSIHDIVPTILAYVGLPVPHDTDGKVLDVFLELDSVSNKKFNYKGRFKLLRRMKKPLIK